MAIRRIRSAKSTEHPSRGSIPQDLKLLALDRIKIEIRNYANAHIYIYTYVYLQLGIQIERYIKVVDKQVSKHALHISMYEYSSRG